MNCLVMLKGMLATMICFWIYMKETISRKQLRGDRRCSSFPGAYIGSWMWSKYMPHFIRDGCVIKKPLESSGQSSHYSLLPHCPLNRI
ncbi:hypothetical protein DFQ01_103431 [Paenibacillus cellulosilyticus]|uniref:Uncharacterized protein n=1 Tax=Paenibacillus cellulosilyticus TaxID=375489 RepID=A0A2V2YXQ5_9BACL|nr:hypothetical protein DFQ01_103431 [Paenibacillus cellulosilyticus]